ncbi:MAG: ATP-binding protein [Gammaproteobacteria bacterium]|nr:ATP-binding protein [Gammaproteobacteria bacterium]
MAAAALKRPSSGVALMIALFALLLVSLYQMSAITENSAEFSRLYLQLLALNALGLLVLAVLITVNLVRLIRQYRAGAAGSRLTLRLLVMFVVLAVAPVTTVFYFSLGFLHRGIDSWFDVGIERALGNALDLSRAALDMRMRELIKQTARDAQELTGVADSGSAAVLNELRSRSGADELTLFSQKGRIITSSSVDTVALVPDVPREAILLQLRQGKNYVGLDLARDAGLHIRVAVNAPADGPAMEGRVLQALFPVAERMSRLADTVQSAFAQYRKLAYLRTPLKYSFTLTLSLVLALSLLTALWAAFYSARRLAAPIRELAEGTRAVAAGHYDTRLPVSGNDELGFLVQSFNDMTRRVAIASDDVKLSQQQAEAQSAYLATLLERLSSGVMTVNPQGGLRTANVAAGQLLGVDFSTVSSLEQLVAEQPQLQPFVDALQQHVQTPDTEWRAEIILPSAGAGRRVFMCRGVPLPGLGMAPPDHLIVFDDMTMLVQAQRDAAWGEVARRLAHEFRNPLTPIQLSAERLRHKYLKTMDAKDAEVLDRLTHTIVQQVEVMKEMVNAFAEYARTPQMRPRLLDLNQLVTEVLDLYRNDATGARLEVHLDPDLPQVEADAGRLRQLLHNLIKNSLEAMPDTYISVSTRCEEDVRCRQVEICVQDSGPGIPEEIRAQLFEPYVTTKPKGTGLGLAIVKKIVEEHGGTLTAEQPADGGTRMIVRLPVMAEATGMRTAQEGMV